MIEKISERLNRIEKVIGYQTKLLESLIDMIGQRTENNQQMQHTVKTQMEQFNKMFAGHPAVRDNPEIANMINSMMSIFEDRKNE